MRIQLILSTVFAILFGTSFSQYPVAFDSINANNISAGVAGYGLFYNFDLNNQKGFITIDSTIVSVAAGLSAPL